MDVLEEYCLSILGNSENSTDDGTVSEHNISTSSLTVSNSAVQIITAVNVPVENAIPIRDQDQRFEDPFSVQNLPIRHPQTGVRYTPVTTHRVKTTAFVCNKGGTGKTTSCINVAGWLAKMDRKVLVIDLDPQASATVGLGVSPSSVSYSIADVLDGICTLSSLIQRTSSGVYLAPANADLLLSERKMLFKGKSSNELKRIVNSLLEQFDHILIDAPAGHGLLTLNAISAGDNLIIPLDASIYAQEAGNTLLAMLNRLETLTGQKLEITAVIVKELARFSMKTSLGGDAQKLQSLFSRHGLTKPALISVPHAPVCDRAANEGMPLAEYAPLSRLSQRFKRVAELLIK